MSIIGDTEKEVCLIGRAVNTVKIIKMSKVSIIGAGNVGATAAQFIAMKEIASEVVLIDVKDGYAEGKAMDISQSLILLESKSEVSGYTKNYEATKDSDIIVITSGTPRKPGMTREELVGINAGIVKSVLSEAYKYSPNAVYVIVSNPVDTMTYLAVKYLKSLGKEDAESTVFGMGGVLDSARFIYYQMKLNPLEKVGGFVVGAHGDTTMIPISVVDDVFEMRETVVEEKTKKGGAELTSLLGTSAWMGPAAAITDVVKNVLHESLVLSPQSVYREEYDACIGTPVLLGKSGILKITTDGVWEKSDRFKEVLEKVKEVNKEIEEGN